ncbi:hypothetical protein [Streptomyces caatingaensis]|uniref:Lipoprotein n=1 Tax=Streptomyces caatingaensis TaxID=1678637 RepID=A0A0K9XD19_9ACTN|nr:hypothetical protein [Streptomyces caatingaensis]KNB51016.1 hypothetical protein AC230_17865 [Streptomyces caatingaensis]
MFVEKSGSKAFAAIGGFVAAVALSVTMTPAAHAAAPTDAEISAALKRHGDGTWTQKDVALIRSIPALAAVVEDVTRPAEVKTETRSVAPGEGVLPKGAELEDASRTLVTPVETDVDPKSTGTPMRTAAPQWRMTHITYTHRSYTGSTIFKYHAYAEFQYNGSKVLKWGQRYDVVEDKDRVAQVKTGRRQVDTKSRTPATSGTSMMKREVELCVTKWGCYSTLHPWAKVKVYGTGKTAIDGTGV